MDHAPVVDPPADVAETHLPPTLSGFAADVARLRGLGCQCPLRVSDDGQHAIPLSPGDARICPYHQDA